MEKARKKQGFTMGELLIVVAIIGILVAISIPIFTSQLKKARIATNQANARAAKVAALAEYQNNTDLDGDYVMYLYNTATGTLEPLTETEEGGGSYVHTKGEMRSPYDDDFNFSNLKKGISGGDVSNLSEANKEYMGSQIVTTWGVKIALKDRTLFKGTKNEQSYKKGEIMMLVYEMSQQQGR